MLRARLDVSAELVRNDSELRRFFRADEIEEIATACAEHRASFPGKRKSLLSKIVADADTMDALNYRRILNYYAEKYPNLEVEGRLEKLYHHLKIKHGRKTGYADFDLVEAAEERREIREELWRIEDDYEEFKRVILEKYGEYLG